MVTVKKKKTENKPKGSITKVKNQINKTKKKKLNRRKLGWNRNHKKSKIIESRYVSMMRWMCLQWNDVFFQEEK